MRLAVLAGHAFEAEGVGAFVGDRDADEAAPVGGHEVDGFGGDFFGGHDEVAFVLTVFVVGDDDHAPGAEFGEDVFDGVKLWSFGHWVELVLPVLPVTAVFVKFRDEHRGEVGEAVLALGFLKVVAVPARAQLVGDLVDDECGVRFGGEDGVGVLEYLALFPLL